MMKKQSLATVLLGFSLTAVTLFVPAFSAEEAAPMAMQHKGEKMQEMMRHVHPMPNYMRTVKSNTDMLDLSEEQQKNLAAWREANHKNSVADAKKVLQLEEELAAASMANASKEEMMKKFDEVAEIRRSIVSRKIDCRDNLRAILNDEQWKMLVELQTGK